MYSEKCTLHQHTPITRLVTAEAMTAQHITAHQLEIIGHIRMQQVSCLWA
jgi:hypothetical protein